MSTNVDKYQLKRAREFLTNIGLSYETLSPSTQNYLLDMTGTNIGDSPVTSGSIISHKFNTKVNSMNGGGTYFPSEYFTDIPSKHYMDNISYNETSTTTNLSRAGIIQSGGGGLLSIKKDYKQLKSQYENKFLRGLNINKHTREQIIQDINIEINNAVLKSIKEHKKGKLTKTILKKNLKF